MLNDCSEEVQRGWSLLTQLYGPSWTAQIDLTRFNLFHSCNCLLGQLHETGDFYEAQSALFGEKAAYETHRHGLCGNDSELAQWEEEWKQTIRAAQEEHMIRSSSALSKAEEHEVLSAMMAEARRHAPGSDIRQVVADIRAVKERMLFGIGLEKFGNALRDILAAAIEDRGLLDKRSSIEITLEPGMDESCWIHFDTFAVQVGMLRGFAGVQELCYVEYADYEEHAS